MNLTTTGFPFGNFPAGGVPMGAARGGAVPQGFALALGAAGIEGFPRVGAGAANDLIPAFANDAAPGKPGGNSFVVTQATPSVTLAQLLAAAGSKATTVDMAEPAQVPGAITVKDGAQAPAATAAQPAAAQPRAAQPAAAAPAALPNGTDKPAPTEEPVQPLVADTPEPEAATEPQPVVAKATPKPAPADAATTTAADTKPPLPNPGTEDQPTTPAPARQGNAAAAQQAATPAKSRKTVATDREGPALPADPQPAQPGTAPAILAGATPPPAQPVAAPDRKVDSGRGGKAAPVASIQPQAQAGTVAPAAGPDRQADAPSGNTPSFSDTALPAEAAHAESRAAATAPAPQQSFAAHVAQSTAQAHAPAPVPAAAPSADPMVPARAGQLGQALGVEIARKVEAGENTLRVRMNPAELGRVEVTLAFDDSGRLHATMRAESHHALELLRQDAPDLGRALDSAGIRTDTQSFRFESRGDGNGGAGGQPGQQQSRGQGQRAFHDEPETPVPAYRPIRGDGQVDLLA